MNFQSHGRPLNKEGMNQICTTLGVSEPEIWAVLTVETLGFGFFQNRQPQILFERHIFHKLTNGKFDNGNTDISNKKPGGYVRRTAEYARLEKAMKLDQAIALQSASWGIGQVMGFNYKAAGFDTIDAMVLGMVESENAQLLAMANFIKNNNLVSPLQRKDWESFARSYNGPEYKKYQYDSRLAAAHAKHSTLLPDLTLRTAQAALTFLNLNPGPIDGLRGRRTRSALLAFQRSVGLPESGELDSHTEEKLLEKAFSI